MDELLGPEMDGYQILLRELKERIRTARLQAALAVNQELILLYWGIGREILERQAREGWGSRVIDRLSVDLRRDFPDMTGLSARNLKYMRALAETHPDRAFVQQVVARLPWGHVVRRQPCLNLGHPLHLQIPRFSRQHREVDKSQ